MNNYEKLKKLCQEANELIINNNPRSSSEFQAWWNKCLIFLSKKFGENSIEYRRFSSIEFSCISTDLHEALLYCQESIKTAINMFESLLEDMEDTNDTTTSEKEYCNDKVFIVHGHDESLKNSVARLLEQQGIEAIILHEKVSTGKTIIEKVEHYGNSVGAAIILFTPDDKGKAVSEKDYKSRARQNVVFEAGYFIGLLGRDKIIPLVSDTSIELPGDLSGVVYTSDMWQFKIMQELREMGFNIDMNEIVF